MTMAVAFLLGIWHEHCRYDILMRVIEHTNFEFCCETHSLSSNVKQTFTSLRSGNILYKNLWQNITLPPPLQIQGLQSGQDYRLESFIFCRCQDHNHPPKCSVGTIILTILMLQPTGWSYYGALCTSARITLTSLQGHSATRSGVMYNYLVPPQLQIYWQQRGSP